MHSTEEPHQKKPVDALNRSKEKPLAKPARMEHYDWRQELEEKCWPGYEKKGMKTMFGKRYPNCVKKTKKEELEVETSSIDEQLKDTNYGRVIGNQKNQTSKNIKITPDIMRKIRLFNLGASSPVIESNETAIESELTIQDWNIDEIKYTEIEAVDIIKPEPLKTFNQSNWRADLGED